MSVEFIAICVNNDGEAFGFPVNVFLKKNAFYRLSNIKPSGLYPGELIAEVYKKGKERIEINENVKCWRISERFVPIFQYSLN